MEQLKITGYTQMADLLNACDAMVDVHGVAMTRPARARRSSRSCCLTPIGPPRRWLGLRHLPYKVTTVETPRYKENLHDEMGYMCLQKNWGDNVPLCTARPHSILCSCYKVVNLWDQALMSATMQMNAQLQRIQTPLYPPLLPRRCTSI
jgi:hypothetical protein